MNRPFYARVSLLTSFVSLSLIANGAPSQLDYKTGKGYEYEYAMRGNYSMVTDAAPGFAGNQSSVGQDCDVSLEVQLVRKEADGSSLMWMKIKSIKASNEDLTKQQFSLADKIALTLPIYFIQESNGDITKVYRQKKEKPEVTNFKRNVIAAFKASSKRGCESERLNQEEFVPHYSTSTTRSGNIIIKKTWDDSSFVSERLREKFSMLRCMGGSLSGEHSTEINTKEGVIEKTTVNVSMDLAKLPRSSSPEIFTQTRTNLQGGLKLGKIRPVVIPATFGKNFELTNLDQEPVPPPFQKVGIPQNAPQDFTQAIHLLRVDKARGALRISSQIQSQVEKLEIRMAATSALAQEGSLAAQETLVKDVLSNTALPEEITRRALTGLVTLPNPLPSTVNAALSFWDSQDSTLRRLSLTAVGSMVCKMAKTQPDKAKGYLDKLHDYLHKPLGEGELMTVLAAIGNAGQEVSIEQINPFLKHESAFVRREAMDALRKFSGSKAMDALFTAVTEDENMGVRQKAMDILEDRIFLTFPDDKGPKKMQRHWKKRVGCGDFAVDVEGRTVCAREPMFAEFKQSVTSGSWGKRWDACKLEVSSDMPHERAGASYFGAYVMGDKVFNSDRLDRGRVYAPDKLAWDYNFDTGPIDLGQFKETFPIYEGITVTVAVNLGGAIGARVQGEINWSNPNDTFVNGGLSPKISVAAGATAVFNIMGFPVGGGLDVFISNFRVPNKSETRMQNGGKNKEDWSGSMFVGAGADAGFLKLRLHILGQDAELLNIPLKAFDEKVIDWKWP